MVIGGLWHGAGFRFILWGALHGIALVIHKLFMSIFPTAKEAKQTWYSQFFTWLITFHFVCFCWIFFRAEDMKIVGDMLSQIAYHFNGQIFLEFIQGYQTVCVLLIIGYALHFTPKSLELKTENFIAKSPLLLKTTYVIIVIFTLVQFKSADIQPFIYFQF
jgi:D-alanyl-lipoteichoic acid acyltransferase DltB (MBOAT superfamily)